MSFLINGLERRFMILRFPSSLRTLEIARHRSKKITRPYHACCSRQLDPTEAIIYEMSVRGFLARDYFKQQKVFIKVLTESPQPNGEVLDLITFQKLHYPRNTFVYDFGSVDEEDHAYNWGYDPVHANVPRRKLSRVILTTYARILELQDTIDTSSGQLECHHGCGLQSVYQAMSTLLCRSFLAISPL